MVVGTGDEWSTVIVKEGVGQHCWFSQGSITVYKGRPFYRESTLGNEIPLKILVLLCNVTILSGERVHTYKSTDNLRNRYSNNKKFSLS